MKVQQIFAFLTITLCFSCQNEETHNDLTLISANYGHLNDAPEIVRPKKHFLKLKEGELFNICISEEIDHKIPGIKAEINSAINIWGHYIGKEIETSVYKFKFDKHLNTNYKDRDFLPLLYKNCPEGTDLIVSMEQLDNQVGAFKYFKRYDHKEKKDLYYRGVFLNKRQISNEDPIRWKSLTQALNKNVSSIEMLEILKSRSTVLYVLEENSLISLRTLVHEFGHAWGLCDQYPVGNGIQTNCDPEHSTVDANNSIYLNPNSIMSESSWEAKLFLTDDDINGIRALYTRLHPSYRWIELEDMHNILVHPIKKYPVSLLKLQSIEESKNTLGLKYSLKTQNQITKIEYYAIFEDGYEHYIKGKILTKPINWKGSNFNLNYKQGNAPIGFKLIVTPLEVDGESYNELNNYRKEATIFLKNKSLKMESDIVTIDEESSVEDLNMENDYRPIVPYSEEQPKENLQKSESELSSPKSYEIIVNENHIEPKVKTILEDSNGRKKIIIK